MMLSPILSVHDVEASIVYYTEVLGFTAGWSMTEDDGKTSFASVKLGEAEVMLGTIDFVAPEDRQKLGSGIQIYIALADDLDIDTLYEHAKSNGANITREIEDRDWGERTFSVRDLDGYHYMIAKHLEKS